MAIGARVDLPGFRASDAWHMLCSETRGGWPCEITKRFGGRVDREHGIAIYEANVHAVKATILASRLLVHNLGDGWEPFGAHLGVPVPAEPYPSRNNASDFQNKVLTK